MTITTETVTIRTGVKNSSIRLVKSDGMWYILPVGFSGMHMTPAESETLMESIREATARAIAMNAQRNTDILFNKDMNNDK